MWQQQRDGGALRTTAAEAEHRASPTVSALQQQPATRPAAAAAAAPAALNAGLRRGRCRSRKGVAPAPRPPLLGGLPSARNQLLLTYSSFLLSFPSLLDARLSTLCRMCGAGALRLPCRRPPHQFPLSCALLFIRTPTDRHCPTCCTGMLPSRHHASAKLRGKRRDMPPPSSLPSASAACYSAVPLLTSLVQLTSRVQQSITQNGGAGVGGGRFVEGEEVYA